MKSIKVGQRVMIGGESAHLYGYESAVGHEAEIRELKTGCAVIKITDLNYSAQEWTRIFAISYLDIHPLSNSQLSKRALERIDD